jgi:DNA-directed RNA polymerase subunit RPC12/RpoP
MVVLTLLGKGTSLLILGKLISKIANLGSKKADVRGDCGGKCIIKKKTSIWKRVLI